MLDNLTDLQTAFAYELREENAPSSSESAYIRRKYFLNRGYQDVANQSSIWWWTETTTTDSTVADQAGYDIPGKMIIEISVDDTVYTPITYEDKRRVTSLLQPVALPYYGKTNKYYLLGSKFYLIPTPSANGTDNIDIVYHQNISEIEGDSSTILVPTRYRMAIVFMGLKNYFLAEKDKDSAAYYEALGKEVIADMLDENARRVRSQVERVRDPEEEI